MLSTIKKALPATLIITAGIGVLAPSAHALYSQPASGITAGGATSSSAGFSNRSVIAQPGVVGGSAGTGRENQHGLLPALGGWRVLYPVISATPGVITFTLKSGASSTQPLALANSGGGSLQWSMAKGNSAENYFSFSPQSGSGDATVTVNANAAGLAPGSYSDILTVSGTGISQTVQIQLTLTVTPGLYRLTMTLVSDTADKGGGSVHSDKGGIACSGAGSSPTGMSGTCSADFEAGTTVTLYQTPDANSTWATWTPSNCGSDQDCEVVMNGDKALTATFAYAFRSKVSSTGQRFETLAESLANAAAADTILARDLTFTENLIIDGKSIVLMGGMSAWYLPLNAKTTLNGKLLIRGGSFRPNRLEIR